MKRLTRDNLIEIGFKEIDKFTILNPLEYCLGDYKYLSISDPGGPNEMVMFYQLDYDDKNITDVIVLNNQDYNGLCNLDKVKDYVRVLTKQKKS